MQRVLRPYDIERINKMAIITKKSIQVDPRLVTSLQLVKVIKPLTLGEDNLHHFVGSQPMKRDSTGYTPHMVVGYYPVYSNDKDDWKIANRKIKEIHTED